MYYVDPACSNDNFHKNVRYEKASEVFNTTQNVQTHNMVLHHEVPNQTTLAHKRPNTANSAIRNRSNHVVRPQSSSNLA